MSLVLSLVAVDIAASFWEYLSIYVVHSIDVDPISRFEGSEEAYSQQGPKTFVVIVAERLIQSTVRSQVPVR